MPADTPWSKRPETYHPPVAGYDELGRTYALTRRPDPRIARAIDAALGEAVSVVNVGAGAGSYEPASRRVVAVEPSETMIRQRPPGAAPAVLGRAEALPLCDSSVDAALAVLTVHHWDDPIAGLRELRRVARSRVVVLREISGLEGFWLTEYFPGLDAVDRPRFLPLSAYSEALGPVSIAAVPIPHDCTDGFLGSAWRRPEAYLDAAVRANMSGLRLLAADEVAAGVGRLARDLESGAWRERHAGLLELEELDLGYRLVVADFAAA